MRIIFLTPGLQALLAYRLGRWLRIVGKNGAWWLPVLLLAPACWLLTAFVRLAYDIHLDKSADIGPGLYIGHFGGILLRNCRVGAHCSIQQEVYLDAAIGSDNGPTIGNYVWIGAHVRIQGTIQIGDRATLGAGTLVTQDVSANCLLLGNPARVVCKNYDNSGFL